MCSDCVSLGRHWHSSSEINPPSWREPGLRAGYRGRGCLMETFINGLVSCPDFSTCLTKSISCLRSLFFLSNPNFSAFHSWTRGQCVVLGGSSSWAHHSLWYFLVVSFFFFHHQCFYNNQDNPSQISGFETLRQQVSVLFPHLSALLHGSALAAGCSAPVFSFLFCLNLNWLAMLC